MNKRKNALSFGIAVLILTVFAGCAIVANGGLDPGTRYLLFKIDPAMTAKSISVGYVEVTGLRVEILDSNANNIDTIEWEVSQGAEEYSVVVDEPGEFQLRVTHIGEGVDVTESTSFELDEMIITVINIIPGMVGAILIDGETTGPTLEELNAAALTAMMGMYESMGAASGGGGELPAGVTLDISEDGGTIAFIFADYVPPETEATVSGTITVDMEWVDGDPMYIDERISGELALTGLGFDTFAMDVYVTIDIVDDGPDFSTAAWTGTITLDGLEVDLDELMGAFFGLL